MKPLIYTLLLTFSLPLFANGSTKGKDLNLYLWEDTLSLSVVAQWEKQTQDQLHLFHFDNDDERSLLMLKSLQLPFDIIVLDNVSAHIFSRQDTFIDLSTLPNRKNMDPRWNKVCGDHAIPYFWGSVGIVYRKSQFIHPPSQWEEIIHPADQYKGHIGLIEDSVETLLPALRTLQTSPVTDKLDQLKKAYQIMEELNQHVLTYEYALSYVRSHKNNENLYMAVGYSGDQYSLNRYFHNDEWDFVTPKGQPYLWIDCMAINSNSEHIEKAKAFLNFLMQPDIAAKNAMDIGSATPNKEALKLLPDSYKNDKSIFVDPEQLEHAMIDQELTPSNLNVRAKIINSLYNQHETKP